MRSGYVDPGYRLYNADGRGDYWSGRAYSSYNAYEHYFGSSDVSPSSSRSRCYGDSVRCVAGWE